MFVVKMFAARNTLGIFFAQQERKTATRAQPALKGLITIDEGRRPERESPASNSSRAMFLERKLQRYI